MGRTPSSPTPGKVLMAVGTRPEAIKMAPVFRSLREHPDLKVTLVSTGQHGTMLHDVFKLFHIVPDHDLALLRPGQSLTQLASRLLAGVEPILLRETPEIVLVHGDTLTGFGVALACFYHQIPVIHIEAGLRSHRLDAPFPEELHRQTLARIAQLHFAPTAEARKNLLRDGVDDRTIVVTGSTAVDALEWVRKSPGYPESPEGLDLQPHERVVTLTLHRRETGTLLMAHNLREIAGLASALPNFRFVYPVHPSPAYRQLAERCLGACENVTLTAPLNYRDFIALLERSHAVITDSGGIQEEAAHLGVPVLLLRDVTERPEAVATGHVHLMGSNAQNLGRALSVALARASHARRPTPVYGAGNAAHIIGSHVAKAIYNPQPGVHPPRATQGQFSQTLE